MKLRIIKKLLKIEKELVEALVLELAKLQVKDIRVKKPDQV
jgi:uncharacterized protein (UPF0216 family)